MNVRKCDDENPLERIRAGKNISVQQLAEIIGCSPNHLWNCIRNGEVEAVRIGNRVSIPSRVAGPLAGIKPDAIAA